MLNRQVDSSVPSVFDLWVGQRFRERSSGQVLQIVSFIRPRSGRVHARVRSLTTGLFAILSCHVLYDPDGYAEPIENAR